MRTTSSKVRTLTLALLLLGLGSGTASSGEPARVLLRRGTEWAATGGVSEETAPPFARRQTLIEAVRRWEYGQDRRPLLELRAAVQAARWEPPPATDPR